MNSCYEWYQYQLIERKKLEKNYSKYKWEIKLNHAFEKFKISCLQTSKLRPVYIQLDIQIDVSRISHFDVIRSDIWIIAGCPRDITLDVEFVCQSISWISKGYICATWELLRGFLLFSSKQLLPIIYKDLFCGFIEE